METREVVLVEVGGYAEGLIRQVAQEFSLGVETVEEVNAAVAHLERRNSEPAAVILGVLESVEQASCSITMLRRAAPHVPILIAAASESRAMVVAALKSGAAGVLGQPGTFDEWRNALEEAMNGGAAALPPPPEPLGIFVGRSPGMASIAAVLRQVAASDAPILIQGETGSGKEVLARAVHAHSRRAKRAFFKLNCAALPSELVESELFGYERGAFTGAFQRKPGIFEAADGGTVLLDEIGDMDVRLQAKLLQVLQDHAFQRIGGKELIHVDVRVLAATHRDLEKAIEDGNFREDLYYRLNVINIIVPPLRDRKMDILELTQMLLQKHAKDGESIPKISPSLTEAMMEWSWPGNVRELENFARKLLIFRDCSLAERQLREQIWRKQTTTAARSRGAATHSVSHEIEPAEERAAKPKEFRVPALAEVEQVTQRAEADAILAALNAAHWNRRVAATLLNVDYKCLLYRMKKLGIEQPRAARGSASADGAAQVMGATASEPVASNWPVHTARAAAAS